jgi:hypothetical protein
MQHRQEATGGPSTAVAAAACAQTTMVEWVDGVASETALPQSIRLEFLKADR